jgi:hypothetical protein
MGITEAVYAMDRASATVDDDVPYTRCDPDHSAIRSVLGSVSQSNVVDVHGALQLDRVGPSSQRERLQPSLPLGHQIAGYQLLQLGTVIGRPRGLDRTEQLLGIAAHNLRRKVRVVLGCLCGREPDLLLAPTQASPLNEEVNRPQQDVPNGLNNETS